MIEVKCDLGSIDLPYMIQVYEVTEEMFYELVDEDTKAELIDRHPTAAMISVTNA